MNNEELILIEKKNNITFDEFKAYMTGLIRGKRGALPDLEDWKRIKQMMDKVQVPAEPAINPYIPTFPTSPTYPTYPTITPCVPHQPWEWPTTTLPYPYTTWYVTDNSTTGIGTGIVTSGYAATVATGVATSCELTTSTNDNVQLTFDFNATNPEKIEE